MQRASERPQTKYLPLDGNNSHIEGGPELRHVKVEDQARTVHHRELHVREPSRSGIGQAQVWCGSAS